MRITLPDPVGFAECFAAVSGVKVIPEIMGITTDSRDVKPEDLYIALSGRRTDGHNFVPAVELEGCSAALVSDVQKECRTIQQIKVDDPLITIGQTAKLWRENVNIPVFGITGTNGKTSTKELIKHVLSENMNVHATEGNYNTSIGVPLTMLTMTSSHEISILELGANQKGDIRYLCEITKPNHGLITNIAPAHLEGFGSVEEIAKEKGELFLALNNGFAFVNNADEKINALPCSGKKISYGLTPTCDFPSDIISEGDGSLTLIIDSEEISTDSRNLTFLKNVIAAAAVSITLGVEWDVFRDQILSFEPPKGRCQVKQFNSVTVIDDTYNANLESTIAALDYLMAFGGNGRKVFIFGDMFELGQDTESHHRKIGEKCKQTNLDAVYLLGEKTLFTDMELNSSTTHRHYSSKNKLISSLKDSFKEGDKILIKGSRGMAMETIIQGIFS
tara:strand:+ start:243 stop:1583 length:1341 start_codon:yes stop_codon:yes gene_type:complete